MKSDDKVQVKFKAQGSSSVLGNFSTGDIKGVDPAFARHLVEEAMCAEYVDASKTQSKPPIKAKPASPGKRGGKKR